MTLINILLGLIGLGIVVFFHELGHYLAARLVGINVEAFSVGWGKPILKKKIGFTEYRLGMFPIGGYCKMQGDSDYNNEAYKNMAEGIKPEKGSYHAASPAARILVSFGGPFFNLLFAILLLSILWGIGFEIWTTDNRVILSSEITGERYPADYAGFQTGDRILEINGRKVTNFYEIQDNIVFNQKKNIPVTVERNGSIVHLQISPELNLETGARLIGVNQWIDPVIDTIIEDSVAQKAGLKAGDIIISANDEPILNTFDFTRIRTQAEDSLTLTYDRNGTIGQVVFKDDDLGGLLGIQWLISSYQTPNYSIFGSIGKGIQESYKTLIRSVTSLQLLFKGIDLSQAVSGPVRITHMMGEVATQGFGQGFGIGFRSIIQFVALISIALCVMNMLPLPILDGGMIILFIVEMIRRKPAHPKFIAVFQTCGMVIIFSLMLFALFGDVMYFIRR
ncbi:MAG: RIP metalloprotease RseP [Treponema sp.]|nr:RIP metalloprotease RseP [Treponema sp.]